MGHLVENLIDFYRGSKGFVKDWVGILVDLQGTGEDSQWFPGEFSRIRY